MGLRLPCCVPRSPRVIARRKQVTDAARCLFAVRGFQNSPMTQISEAAGIKVGQIYRDFDGKEAIVADIVREDLQNLLDEPSLDAAIAANDVPAMRDWVVRFIQRDGAPRQDGLLSQIIVEAARNERIAALLREADRQIAMNICRALAAIAPGAARESKRNQLVDVIIVLLTGLSQRTLAVPETNSSAIAISCSALIERELDRLLAAADD